MSKEYKSPLEKIHDLIHLIWDTQDRLEFAQSRCDTNGDECSQVEAYHLSKKVKRLQQKLSKQIGRYLEEE